MDGVRTDGWRLRHALGMGCTDRWKTWVCTSELPLPCNQVSWQPSLEWERGPRSLPASISEVLAAVASLVLTADL